MKNENTYTILDPLFFICDQPKAAAAGGDHSEDRSKLSPNILANYYNDIYKLFLNKLAKFDSQPTVTDAEQKKLQSLLTEIIYVKGLLGDEK
jgi:hypothetical protein